MAKHVFVRIEEGENGATRSTSCILLSGEDAESFIADPKNFFGEYGNDATVLASWIVSEELMNATTGRSNGLMNEALEAILSLNALNDAVISNLLATIFEAGFQCGQQSTNDHHGFTTFTAP